MWKKNFFSELEKKFEKKNIFHFPLSLSFLNKVHYVRMIFLWEMIALDRIDMIEIDLILIPVTILSIKLFLLFRFKLFEVWFWDFIFSNLLIWNLYFLDCFVFVFFFYHRSKKLILCCSFEKVLACLFLCLFSFFHKKNKKQYRNSSCEFIKKKQKIQRLNLDLLDFFFRSLPFYIHLRLFFRQLCLC